MSGATGFVRRSARVMAAVVMMGTGVLVLTPTSAAAAESGVTRLTFDSDAGDWIGQGVDETWTRVDGAFSATYANDLARVNFDGGSTWWRLDFKAPTGALSPGSYEGATRYPFQASGTPGLSVSGSGRGCNTLTGRFDIFEIDVAPDCTLRAFSAGFTQVCGGRGELRGNIRYHSDADQIATTPSDPARRHRVTARYAGDANHLPSSG